MNDKGDDDGSDGDGDLVVTTSVNEVDSANEQGDSWNLAD